MALQEPPFLNPNGPNHSSLPEDANALKQLLSHEQYLHQNIVQRLKETLQELRLAQDNLRLIEEHHHLLNSISMEGTWEWDLLDDTFALSKNWENILGLNEDHTIISFDQWLDYVHTDDQELLTNTLQMHLGNGNIPLKCEYRLRNNKGVYIWVCMNGVSLRDSAGNAYRIAGSHINISEQKKLRNLLNKNACYDHLTGLLNRNFFMEYVSERITEFQKSPDVPYAIIMINLDHFKQYNDSLGPLKCDQILMEIAQRLENICQLDDIIGRWGADEFAIIINEFHSKNHLEIFAERLLQRIEEPIQITDTEINLRAGIGIALSSPKYQKPEEIIRDADIALCNARKSYASRYTFFDSSMLQETDKKFYIENSLQKALERQEITIAYQPIVNLKNSKIAGFEALMRWHHPKMGFISPADFIPLAEESDLILSLGRFVLRTACEQAAYWNNGKDKAALIFISINVSTKQLMDPNFILDLKDTLKETGLNPECVELEITETTLIENPDYISEVVNKIVSTGVSIYIDDFGTGHSSLATLHKYPFKTLKIDRSFIIELESDHKTRELFNHIVLLAKGLGMDIVVEGIETKSCLDIIFSTNCEYGQGYYFSKAVPQSEAFVLLQNGLK